MAATDFTVFRTGWSLILQGRAKDLYDAVAQETVQNALLRQVGSTGFQDGMMAFLHPPHAALAGCVFGWVAQRFGDPFAFWIWTACSLGCLTYLVRLVRDELRTGPRATLLVAVTLAAFYPVLETLQQGQVSLLLGVAALACVLALRKRRPFVAALWLLVLSIKPQTLPALLVVLAVRRERKALFFAALLGAGAVLVTTLSLGTHVWWDYLTRVAGLERHFGVGTPDHMPTVRGLLTRLARPFPRFAESVDSLSLVTWFLAIASAALMAGRSRPSADGRAPLAFALAVGALASPHLFPQDVLLWVAPVTLVLSLSRDGREDDWLDRTRIVLAWPLWFVMARALDVRDTPRTRLPIDLTIIPLVIATVWTAREASRASSTPAS